MIDKDYKVLILSNIKISGTYALLGIYFIIIVHTFLTFKMYENSYSVVKTKKSDIPTTWFVINKNVNFVAGLIWIFTPLIVCSFSMSIYLTKLSYLYALLPGFVITVLPNLINEYIGFISSKRDNQNNLLSFSMYLLYWFRLLRSIFISLIFILPILVVINEWDIKGSFINLMFGILIVMAIVRIIGSFIYYPIDKIGKYIGFSQNYPYKK